MARPSNTAERRAQIVDGLLQVMARDGYERASVQAIAKAAKLAPGLVHYHFETKQAVLLELVDRLVRTVRERYLAKAESATGALGRLEAFIDAHLALGGGADGRAVAAWSVIGTEAAALDEVRRPYRRALTQSRRELDRLVRACLKEAGQPATGAAERSAALLLAIEGAFRVAAAAPGALPRGSAAPVVKRLARALV